MNYDPYDGYKRWYKYDDPWKGTDGVKAGTITMPKITLPPKANPIDPLEEIKQRLDEAKALKQENHLLKVAMNALLGFYGDTDWILGDLRAATCPECTISTFSIQGKTVFSRA